MSVAASNKGHSPVLRLLQQLQDSDHLLMPRQPSEAPGDETAEGSAQVRHRISFSISIALCNCLEPWA